MVGELFCAGFGDVGFGDEVAFFPLARDAAEGFWSISLFHASDGSPLGTNVHVAVEGIDESLAFFFFANFAIFFGQVNEVVDGAMLGHFCSEVENVFGFL